MLRLVLIVLWSEFYLTAIVSSSLFALSEQGFLKHVQNSILVVPDGYTAHTKPFLASDLHSGAYPEEVLPFLIHILPIDPLLYKSLFKCPWKKYIRLLLKQGTSFIVCLPHSFYNLTVFDILHISPNYADFFTITLYWFFSTVTLAAPVYPL